MAAPALTISTESGQLTGEGQEGFYWAGRRSLARCHVLVAGREPLPARGWTVGAEQAYFVGTLRLAGTAGPDPEVTVERVRSAAGTERITVRNFSLRDLRLPVEVRLATDFAELSVAATGRQGPWLPAAVHGSGLRWSAGETTVTVTARPAPETALAPAGLLRWELEVPAGGSREVTLDVITRAAGPGPVPMGVLGPVSGRPDKERRPRLWAGAGAEADDDHRIGPLFQAALDDLNALLERDATEPRDLHVTAGVPWRCAPAPADALRAARMLLPLGTRLAAGTLRALARGQRIADGPGQGRLSGALRGTGPGGTPRCTGLEATLLFPAVLTEAWLWGLPSREAEILLPAAEKCLRWLLDNTRAGGYLPDPGPGGAYFCDTQARAHRAAVLGADLLEAHGRPGAEGLRDWAAELRRRFREDFWYEDISGGRPLEILARDGDTPRLHGSVSELLDTGLARGGAMAVGLLDGARTEHLARLLGAPAMDSGWGLRSLGSKEAGHNPFGHRDGAVRVQDTATAVAGLAAAGYEKEATSLLRGTLDAAEAFGRRLPEMYAAEQRTEGSVPLPHPAACRPAAVAAAGTVQLLTVVAGLRPDAPAGTVAIRPMASAPLGAVRFTGLRVGDSPFAVRISRLGMGMVEEAADGLQLLC